MAKVKVKLDVAAIKKWLLEHGEKLAFGFTVLIFLMFTWSAIRSDVLEPSKQPTQLQQQATDVGLHVTKSQWNDETAKTAAIEIIPYDERAKREQIVAATFPTVEPFDRPLADPKIKRGSPELLPIEEVKVASGFGTFSLKGDAAAAPPGSNRGGGGNTMLKGLPWVAITGLVPDQKQAREFARVFDRALGGNRDRDSVRYVGFKIERAEINDQDPAKLDWKPLARAPIADQFAQGLTEVVKPDFVDSMLTMPLRPLVGADWGDAVTHPKIPLAVQSKAQVQAPPPADDAPKEADPKETEGSYLQAHAKTDQAAKTVPAASNAAKPDDTEIGYRLFRAFDFTVEPNRKYRYRVVVGLENPNFGLPRQNLKDPETAKQKYLDTNPTEPSGPISVPDGYQVLAGVVKPSKLGEPAAKLMLIAIDKENGMEPAYEYDVWRGSVANTTVKELNVLNRQTKKIDEMTDVKFRSDMVVLDIRGGKLVGKKGSNLTAPGEVLLLDRNGDLMVRSELDDQSMYEKRVPPEAQDTRAKNVLTEPPKPKPMRKKPVRN